MDLGAAAEALMRRKILEDIYDRMSDEEKRLFVQLTMQQKSADEIMSALHRQSDISWMPIRQSTLNATEVLAPSRSTSHL